MGLRQAELGCKPMTVGSSDWLERSEAERLPVAESRWLSSALAVAAKRLPPTVELCGTSFCVVSVILSTLFENIIQFCIGQSIRQ